MKKLLIDLIDKLMNFLNSRNPREKMMFILLAGAGVLVLDTLVFIQPVAKMFMAEGPELSTVGQDLRSLQDDYKNRDQIEKSWTKAKEALLEKEKMFIAPNEVPALLENLSKLAQSSGVKILTLKPEAVMSDSGHYQRIPIKISGLAGAHEFGRFLAKLESSPTFFRVTDVRIQNSLADTRRHSVDLIVEAYRKGI